MAPKKSLENLQANRIILPRHMSFTTKTAPGVDMNGNESRNQVLEGAGRSAFMWMITIGVITGGVWVVSILASK